MGPRATIRHAVITGASSGLGAALAVTLAQKDRVLTLLGRDQHRLNQVVAECAAKGALARGVFCDVTDRSAMQDAMREADRTNPVDLLAANAGLGGREVLAGPAGESAELVRRVFDVNTHGVFNTIIPMIGPLMERKSGHIVIVSSIMAFQGIADAPAYSASKAAARIYGQALRRMLKPFNINVTVVCPGFIDTPMSHSLPYVKPFCVSAEDAARRIIRGTEQRKAEIIFPWQFRALSSVINLMPSTWADRLLADIKTLAVRGRQQ